MKIIPVIACHRYVSWLYPFGHCHDEVIDLFLDCFLQVSLGIACEHSPWSHEVCILRLLLR
jgi:hypothetical protein